LVTIPCHVVNTGQGTTSSVGAPPWITSGSATTGPGRSAICQRSE
jgi:hypothetical protein